MIPFITVFVSESCSHCKFNFTVTARAEDESGIERFYSKCRYCGRTSFEGPGSLAHVLGVTVERLSEYLQATYPIKFEKKDTQ